MSISPYLTGSFVDFMINNKDVHRVVYLSSIIMLIGIAGVVLAYCKNTLSVKITSQVSFDLLRDITKHFEKVKLSIVETIDSTYLTQQINTDVNVITGFVISNIIPMFMNVILAMAIICLFISINKYLLVLMVVLIVPYIILYANMHQPLYEKFLDKKKQIVSSSVNLVHKFVKFLIFSCTLCMKLVKKNLIMLLETIYQCL